MEQPGFIPTALGHQETKVRVGIDPGSEGLNDSNDSGHKIVPGDKREVMAQGTEGQAAK